ncbi:hypothetical protein JAAARDRAFT_188407 [Jaapia argillacea MUCL 33604]|uniref:Uncharacterized protein n=1 Tax=Jaapia argillacea MUCL 33604 TaxID=933084 RepID=A0A067QG34_9AGAM|nr:hypothetical protein JAAARDRAFT_188407 [Jaapia argillacea MUCL 33604]
MADHSPLLRSFSVPSFSRVEDPSQYPALKGIESFRAPNLRQLILAESWHPSILPFPSSRLTNIHIGDSIEDVRAKLKLTSCFDILRQCVELTHCRLYVDDPDDSRPPTTFNADPIVLPQLRFFQLNWSYHDSLLIERLVAPKLKELRYEPPYFSDM